MSTYVIFFQMKIFCAYVSEYRDLGLQHPVCTGTVHELGESRSSAKGGE